MCGRFYVDDDTAREIEKTIRQIDEKMRKGKRTGDIHPTETAMVITAQNHEMVLDDMKWGMPKINDSGVVINARAESVLERKMFREDILKHRIIIPASGFYEWNRNKEKAAFTSMGEGGQAKSVLYMAGFYGHFGGEERFVILTTAANESMKDTHDRMPLILESCEIRDWLLETGKFKPLLSKQPKLLQKQMEYEQQRLFV